MNSRERTVKERYEREGWIMLRPGAPDFLAVREREVRAVEVKRPEDVLSPVQEQYRAALERVGVPYVVEVVGHAPKPMHDDVLRQLHLRGEYGDVPFVGKDLLDVEWKNTKTSVHLRSRVTRDGYFEEVVDAFYMAEDLHGFGFILSQIGVT